MHNIDIIPVLHNFFKYLQKHIFLCSIPHGYNERRTAFNARLPFTQSSLTMALKKTVFV